MKILVINAGSSSLKYQLFEMPEGKVLAKGLCECIGIEGGTVTHKRPGQDDYKVKTPLDDHEAALAWVLKLLTDTELGVIADISEIGAVGHRIAHGGEKLRASCLIDDEVITYLESIVPINPLHGPPAIAGMRGCRKLMENVPMVGVFDTSFHSTMPEKAYIYPIPYELYEEKSIRRYGFHGTSHRYVSGRAAEMLGKKPEELKIITCHLGNGSSITAVNGGKVVDTTMGFTPQEGILMGTRSGSVDPTIVTYLQSQGMTAAEVEKMLNKQSGLLGVSGKSSDARVVCDAAAEGDKRSQLALEILYYGIKKYIGAYTAAMNGLDVLVFTAGIGENDRDLRRRVCQDMDYLGIAMDEEVNATCPRGKDADVSAADSRVKILVIPTDEEYMIALDTARLAAD
ncbi:MAG: acetate kinase [Clostridia bacterium]|nr:acetate kinase [Clostridia bacterium]